jgi:hypothetical protein
MQNVRQRQPRYEDPKLRKLCHEVERCFIGIPGVCQFSPTECVHSDAQKHGRGKDYKTHDFNALPGCRPCHLAYGANQDEYQEYVDRGLESWRWHLFVNRLVRVV